MCYSYINVSVNVDDVVDDVFRQIRGVSDDISGALKLATSGIRQRFPLGSGDLGRSVATNSTQISTTLPSQSSTSQLSGPLAMLAIPDGDLGEKSLSNSTLEGECKGNYGTHLEDSGQGVGSIQWHSDGETARDPIEVNILKTAAPVFSSQSEMRGYQLFGRPLERALSEGHSPADSFASDVIEDELVIPQEVSNSSPVWRQSLVGNLRHEVHPLLGLIIQILFVSTDSRVIANYVN